MTPHPPPPEDTPEEIAHARRLSLRWMMREYSELHYSAGWLFKLEERIVEDAKEHADAADILEAAKLCGGIFTWEDGETDESFKPIEALNPLVQSALAPPPKKKRAKPFSATQATRTHLKSLGLTSQITERWNAFARKKQDLFGFVDIVALDPKVGIIGIQATTMDHVANRRTKIEEHENLSPWLLSGGVVEVWGFGLRGGRGKRKLWTLRRERLVGPGTWVEIPNETVDTVPHDETPL